MTITVRMFIQIFLMVVLCGTEIAQRLYLNRNRFSITLLQQRNRTLNHLQIFIIDIIDACPILRTVITTLSVDGNRVN
ncbi:hypothetical protein SDC9_152986 [bioreactor metagenome]|uniref:Uncharacterized protein n=1 Tax=bioreactor metagenome TaxID=1076179 RepID=A0A645EZA2_9ZZZZ